MSARVSLLLAVSLIALNALGTCADVASASHNRASQLTWRTTSNANEAHFDVSFVARRGYYGAPNVGDTLIDPTISFGDGASTTPALTVVAIDAPHDVVYAAASLDHKYTGPGPYTASLDGCCRLQSSSGHVNNPDLSFRAETKVNLGTLGSPHSSIDPIVDCRPDSVCSFSVVGLDPTGNRLRWRLATPAEATGGTFNQPGPPFAPNAATINPATGRYSWDSTGAQRNSIGETLYSTQVIIESLDANGGVVASAAVDFFIRLTDTANSTVTPPCEDTDQNGSTDNDQDGLCDNWETTGIDADNDGTVDLRLYDQNRDGTISSVEAADPNVKDIFVEIDYMDGLKPDLAALNGVTRAFASAPTPIRLHYRVDDQIPYSSDVIFGNCGGPCPAAPTFDDIKADWFGQASERASVNEEPILNAKRFAFHYVEWINGIAGLGSTSGVAELPGNDFIVSLGRWDVTGGTPDQQAGTFMHEMGHNLGLHHGGGDDINCKPNYLSVMSYTRQNTGAYVSRRPLDYSRTALPTLNEGALDERAGIGIAGPTSLVTAHGPYAARQSSAAGSIDWNFAILGIQSSPVSADINNLGDTTCPGDGDILIGYDDWAHVSLEFQATADFSDGVHSTTYSQPSEVDYPSQAAVSPDTDGDGVLDLNDLCPRTRDPLQHDSDGDGVGDACQPIARDDSLTARDGRVDLEPPGLLTNDTVADGKVEEGTRTTAQGGTATLTDSGGLRYSAPPGFTGVDRFTYRLVNDPASSTATVTVTVEGPRAKTQAAAAVSPAPPPLGSARDLASFKRSPRTVRVSRRGVFGYRFMASPGSDGTVRIASVKAVRVGAKHRRLTLPTRRFTAPTSGDVLLQFKVSARAVRALRALRAVRFSVQVDVGGKRFHTSLTLKPPR